MGKSTKPRGAAPPPLPFADALEAGDAEALGALLLAALRARNPAVTAVADVRIAQQRGEAFTGGRSTPVYDVAATLTVRGTTKHRAFVAKVVRHGGGSERDAFRRASYANERAFYAAPDALGAASAAFPDHPELLRGGALAAAVRALARFHAAFYAKSPAAVEARSKLFPRGTFWRLDAPGARPFAPTAWPAALRWLEARDSGAGSPLRLLAARLGRAAPAIDARCGRRQRRTVVHGDWKAANLFFSDAAVACVDFQNASVACRAEKPTDLMMTMSFSPPRHGAKLDKKVPVVRRVEFAEAVKKPAEAKPRPRRRRRRPRPSSTSAPAVEAERLERLAESAKKASLCESPAPWRLQPKRDALTPRDAESRESKRHVAALRLQTLLHHRRAEKARAKTVLLEKLQAARSRPEDGGGVAALSDARRALAEANKRADVAEADASADRRRAAAAEARAGALEKARRRAAGTPARAQVEAGQARGGRRGGGAGARRGRRRGGGAAARGRGRGRARRELAAREARRAQREAAAAAEGNIRVFVRVRPALAVGANGSGTTAGASPAPRRPRVVRGRRRVAEQVAPAGRRKARTFKFAYDRVLDGAADQVAVFREVRPFVQSALDGYKVCVFAYGQAGSGKTHTMLGGGGPAASAAPGADAGLLQRSLHLVFDGVEQLKAAQGWTFELSVEMLEIYLDKVYDLLGDGGEPQPRAVRDTGEAIAVDGLTRVAVSCAEEADLVLAARERPHVRDEEQRPQLAEPLPLRAPRPRRVRRRPREGHQVRAEHVRQVRLAA
ncbi:hypothetical protein JL722_14619 [Aureococcus anophagefferens]|nr:hypothetical protein JL722_14619 [Aureococcus anophagefferens]